MKFGENIPEPKPKTILDKMVKKVADAFPASLPVEKQVSVEQRAFGPETVGEENQENIDHSRKSILTLLNSIKDIPDEEVIWVRGLNGTGPIYFHEHAGLLKQKFQDALKNVDDYPAMYLHRFTSENGASFSTFREGYGFTIVSEQEGMQYEDAKKTAQIKANEQAGQSIFGKLGI